MINSLPALERELANFPVRGVQGDQRRDNIRIRAMKVQEWQHSPDFMRFKEATRGKADQSRRKRNGRK